MSGTAGLSAAKNRRSGNEVKFNGQSKSMPPPEQTSVTAQPIMRQQNIMPNPMEILKSHEFRLQQLEGENMEQDFLNHKVDFLTLKTDFLTLKNELLTNNKISKADVTVTSKSDVANKVDVVSCGTTNSAEVTNLQQRVSELNTIVTNLTKEIASIKQYIREKVDPTLTKVLQAKAPAPAILPLEEIHLSTPLIEPEIITILDNKIEPVFDNITLTIGC